MAHDEEDDEAYDDSEQVLFQGPMFGREANLKQNPRLVKAGLVPVKRMISDALARRAHTILLEPARGSMSLRVVVDGIPYSVGALPAQRGMAMVQMTKVLAGLDPQEREQPQTGGIKAEFEDTRYELHVEVVPLKPGVERLKIRVDNPKITYLTARDAGMPDDLAAKLRSYTEDSRGVILACGQRESGATSLSIVALHCVDPYLYSVFNLSDLNGKELINVTDYTMEPGHDLEISFDRILRREADIMFMGKQTDPAAVQTIFDFADRMCFVMEIDAPNPADAVRQLIEWVGKDAVATRVKGVISQKLIRKLCDDCKQAFRPNPALLNRLGLPPETSVLYRAPTPPDPEDPEATSIEELCEDCDGVPFYGRAPVYELMEMTDGMREVVLNNFSPETVKQQMAEEGMRTLQKDALRLVAEGKTALEEVQRAFAPPGGAGRRPKGRPRPRPPQ